MTLTLNPSLQAEFGGLGTVCRLGLSTRGNTRLEPDDVLAAIARGVDYLNWCGHPDGLSAAVRRLGDRRRDVRVAVQLSARTARAARRELDAHLGELGTPFIDVVTYYYVEADEEWREIHAKGGAAEAIERARAEGVVRSIGVTTHQRDLAARIASTARDDRRIDMLMIRYNAAHRGAEQDVFPVTAPLGLPVVTYTGLRWGALLRPTPDDPPGFEPPRAPAWYRFVLCHPAVTVGIMAPDGREELDEDLALLDNDRAFTDEEYRSLCDHGDRVRKHAGRFP